MCTVVYMYRHVMGYLDLYIRIQYTYNIKSTWAPHVCMWCAVQYVRMYS